MNRPNITNGDIDLTRVIGITSADGWVAEYSSGEKKPVLFWVLLDQGELVGLVSGDGAGTMTMIVRAADKIQNFVGYRLLVPVRVG